MLSFFFSRKLSLVGLVVTFFNSEKCQKKDWSDRHKTECKTLREEANVKQEAVVVKPKTAKDLETKTESEGVEVEKREPLKLLPEEPSMVIKGSLKAKASIRPLATITVEVDTMKAWQGEVELGRVVRPKFIYKMLPKDAIGKKEESRSIE